MKTNAILKACRRYRALFMQQQSILIPIKYTCEQDFFDPQDCLGITLCPSISRYLNSCLASLPRRGSVTVVFYGPAIRHTKHEAVCSLVKTHYALKARALAQKALWAALGAALCLVFAGLTWRFGGNFPGGGGVVCSLLLLAGALCFLARLISLLLLMAQMQRLFLAQIKFHAAL